MITRMLTVSLVTAGLLAAGAGVASADPGINQSGGRACVGGDTVSLIAWGGFGINDGYFGQPDAQSTIGFIFGPDLCAAYMSGQPPFTP